MPIPYSITNDGENVELPAKLDQVHRLSPEMARVDMMGAIEDVKSIISPDISEKTESYFKNFIL
jgi:hypothetical protein